MVSFVFGPSQSSMREGIAQSLRRTGDPIETSQARSTDGPAALMLEDELPYASSSEATSAPPTSELNALERDFCSHTDVFNSYYEGECATQQELDEAWITLIALDEDVYGVDVAAVAGTNSYCDTNPNDCPWAQEASSTGEIGPRVAAAYSSALLEDGDPSTHGVQRSPPGWDSGIGEFAGDFTCAGYWAAYGSSLAWFGSSIWGLSSTLTAATVAGVAATGVGALVLGGVAAAGAVVASAIFLHQCYMT